ncbi:MAG: glycosyltransferase family 4 protein [Candidatus Burarchaeum sp.]|nr:glycosyltransferase family 4 protein [Candidatus Burarchaeum sp.]MDO8339042.1 glycosyltransferase family 4 protein [Candidatus Burarchaeum sp.]
MREIRVLFDFGASGRHHSLYDEILEAPPAGVHYTVPSLSSRRIPHFAVKAYQKVRGALDGKIDLAHLARRVNRAAITREVKYDVVHMGNHLDPVPSPFVVDFEQALSFMHGKVDEKNLAAEVAKLRAERTRAMESEQCKFLLPWTNEGAKSVWKAFPSKKIKEKTRVVSLAMQLPQEHKPIAHEGFKVLFLGTSNLGGEWNFYYRGGRRLLRVFEMFAKGRKDAELVMTGEIPPLERAYAEKIGRCRITGLMSREELGRTIRSADVLLFPSYGTPGLAFLEAKRHHLPIITTDAWANREIVDDGKDGLIVPFVKFRTRVDFGFPLFKHQFIALEKHDADVELEKGLVRALEKMRASSPKQRRKMGDAGFHKVAEGKFSISARNKKLRQIYAECVE